MSYKDGQVWSAQRTYNLHHAQGCFYHWMNNFQYEIE